MTATSASPGPSSGTGTSSRCSDLRGSLSRVSRPGEHLRLVLVHGDRAVRLGEWQGRRSRRRCCPREDRVQDFLHGVPPAMGLPCSSGAESSGSASRERLRSLPTGVRCDVEVLPSVRLVRLRRCSGGAEGLPVTQASGRAGTWLAGTAGVREVSARRPPGQLQRMAPRATWQDTACQQFLSLVIRRARMSNMRGVSPDSVPLDTVRRALRYTYGVVVLEHGETEPLEDRTALRRTRRPADT